MNREQLISLGLSAEHADKVMELLDGNFVTKARFDEVNTTKNRLENTLKERDGQLAALGDTEAEAQQLKKTVEELRAGHEREMKGLRLNSALDKALLEAGAKNTKAVRALLGDFIESAELDGDRIKGLDGALAKLMTAKDSEFLFEGAARSVFKGIKPAERSDKPAGAPVTLAAAIRSALSAEQA